RYPDWDFAMTGATVSLPLLIGERPLGALRFGFATDRIFTGHELKFMATLAHLGAQAMERALLFDAERRARRQAEEEVQERKRAEESLRASERFARQVADI